MKKRSLFLMGALAGNVAPKVARWIGGSRSAIEKTPPASNECQSGTQEHLAAGLAHEFNNFLTVIDGYTSLLLADPPEDLAALRALEEINKASGKAMSLTRQMQSFARRQPLRPRRFDPATLLRSMHSWLEQLAGEQIRLVITARDGEAFVRCDPALLEEAIALLAAHARGRMEAEGGTLTLQLAYGAGETLQLTVRDTGPALEEPALEHMFQPFYSSQPRSKGAGMALAAVRGFALQSGGGVAVESIPGEGTAIILSLPVDASKSGEATPAEQNLESIDTIPAQAPIQAQAAAAPKPDMTGLNVLLVEDEDTVRRIVMQMLERRGIKPLEAGNGNAALELVRHAERPLDVLLTDISMPGMDGVELYQRLIEQHPGLKVIFMSGYARETVEAETPLPNGCGFLIKPFTPERMINALSAQMQG